MDISITISLISLILVTISSLVSPLISAKLNNKHAEIMEEIRRKYDLKQNFQSERHLVYSEALSALGKVIYSPSPSNAGLAGEKLYALYIFLPAEYHSELDEFIPLLKKCEDTDIISPKALHLARTISSLCN